MLTQKKFTKRLRLYTFFITLVVFLNTPLSAMLTGEELILQKKKKEKANKALAIDLVMNSSPRSIKETIANGAGNNREYPLANLYHETAMENAARFSCPPPIIHILHNLDETSIKNNNILIRLIRGFGSDKEHFSKSALTFLELGTPTDGKNWNGDSLLDYSIQQYNWIATIAYNLACSRASKDTTREIYNAKTNNLGTIISMLFYVDEHKIDFEKALNLMAPQHRNKFRRKHCSYFLDQSALRLLFIPRPKPNLTNPFHLLPQISYRKIASYLGSPWQGTLKKRRKLNQLEYQLQLAEQKKEEKGKYSGKASYPL